MNARRRAILLLLSLLLVTSNLAYDRPAAAATQMSATFTTAWYQGSAVSYVRNAVNGIVEGGSITWVQCRDTRYWWWQNGWQEQAHDFGCPLSEGGDWAHSNTYARHYSSQFSCPYTGGVGTNYDRNYAYISPSGATGFSTTWPSGNCADYIWVDKVFEPGVCY